MAAGAATHGLCMKSLPVVLAMGVTGLRFVNGVSTLWRPKDRDCVSLPATPIAGYDLVVAIRRRSVAPALDSRQKRLREGF